MPEFKITLSQRTKPVKGFVQYQVIDRNSLKRFEGSYSDCLKYIESIQLNRLNDE